MAYIPNRSAMMLVPLKPMLDWVNALPDNDGVHYSTESLMEDPEIFLIPPFEDDEDLVKIYQTRWKAMFEVELEGWCLDRALWPQQRSLDLFFTWFSLVPFSMVRDFGIGAIEIEED